MARKKTTSKSKKRKPDEAGVSFSALTDEQMWAVMNPGQALVNAAMNEYNAALRAVGMVGRPKPTAKEPKDKPAVPKAQPSRGASRVLAEVKKAHDEDRGTPTYDNLEHATGLSRTTVSKHMKELREKGYLPPKADRTRS